VRQRQKEQKLEAWKAECAAVKQRKEAAAAAKAKAEADFGNARTQQEAERVDKAMRDAAAALKVGSKLFTLCVNCMGMLVVPTLARAA
jgi:hypothetical protein